MAKWVVRGQYPTGDVVEEFEDAAEAQATMDRHRRRTGRVAVGGPAFPGQSVPTGVGVPTRCSFCGLERREVGDLIAGPTGAGMAIHGACAALCVEMLAERPR